MIAYITANTPFGAGEEFVLTELIALKEAGGDILIIPRDKPNMIFHKKAELLLKDTLNIPWLDFKILWQFLNYIFIKPVSLFDIVNNTAFKARNMRIALKNLIVLSKALYLSKICKQISISHIHAHWASTTATMAYIISKATGIPWSFTAHRWDITENNLLREKCETASFVRAISEKGRGEMIEIIKDVPLTKKISVIHMGVVMPEFNKVSYSRSNLFSFICPANLVLVKGHKYLFEACQILADKNLEFKCIIAGDGPLEHELKGMVNQLDLGNYINFLGRLSHDEIINLYSSGRVDAVVIPSIITEYGEAEGIPVALMEAMSYGIPVISTNTGGIPELIGDGSGVIVNEKDPKAIADAIERLMKDTSYYEFMSQLGRRKVEKEFNLSLISKELLNLFSN